MTRKITKKAKSAKRLIYRVPACMTSVQLAGNAEKLKVTGQWVTVNEMQKEYLPQSMLLQGFVACQVHHAQIGFLHYACKRHRH